MLACLVVYFRGHDLARLLLELFDLKFGVTHNVPKAMLRALRSAPMSHLRMGFNLGFQEKKELSSFKLLATGSARVLPSCTALEPVTAVNHHRSSVVDAQRV